MSIPQHQIFVGDYDFEVEPPLPFELATRFLQCRGKGNFAAPKHILRSLLHDDFVIAPSYAREILESLQLADLPPFGSPKALLPVVEAELQTRGILFETTVRLPSRIPSFSQSEAIEATNPTSVARFIAENEYGRLVLAAGCSRIRLIRSIIEALPNSRIAIVVESTSAATQLYSHLSVEFQRLKDIATVITRSNADIDPAEIQNIWSGDTLGGDETGFDPTRVVFGTPSTLLSPIADMPRRDLLLIASAKIVLHAKFRMIFNAPDSHFHIHCILGQVPISRKLEDRIAQSVGHREFVADRMSRSIPPRFVRFERVSTDLPTATLDDPVTAIHGLENCVNRNRRIAKLAKSEYAQNVCAWPEGQHCSVVVCATREHLMALADMLEDWGLLLSEEIDRSSVASRLIPRIAEISQSTIATHPSRLITTTAQLHRLGYAKKQTFIWVGSRPEGPSFPSSLISHIIHGPSQFSLVDVVDTVRRSLDSTRRPIPMFKEWYQSRRDSYFDAGWTPTGVDRHAFLVERARKRMVVAREVVTS